MKDGYKIENNNGAKCVTILLVSCRRSNSNQRVTFT